MAHPIFEKIAKLTPEQWARLRKMRLDGGDLVEVAGELQVTARDGSARPLSAKRAGRISAIADQMIANK